MAKYTGSTTLISGITQKNSGSFALVEASAVQYKNEENQDGTFKSVEKKIEELSAAVGNPDIMSDDDLTSMLTEIFG